MSKLENKKVKTSNSAGKNPTRQQTLAKKIAENSGKPMGLLMRESGYAASYCRSPDKLKKTLKWQEIMDMCFPDDLLFSTHKKLLNKKEYIVIRENGEYQLLATGRIDANAVAKGLDMAYKIRGLYRTGKAECGSNNGLRAVSDRIARIPPASND